MKPPKIASKFFWFSALIVCLALFVACEFDQLLITPVPTTPPPTPTPEPTLTPTPVPGSVDGFRLFLSQAENAPLENRQELVNRYLAQLTASPITSESQAIFLWRGEAQSVHLLGDMNNWLLNEAPEFSRLQGTDLWTLSLNFEADARLDYKIVLDEEDWLLDPLNPRIMVGGLGPNSELVMPAYQSPLLDELPGGDIPRGDLNSFTLQSHHLNQTRTFFVYVPAGQVIGQELPSIYFQDGSDYLNYIDTTDILDRLITQRQIPPLVAVFIPPINRNSEYHLNSAYTNFLADELVPFVQENFRVSADPGRTGLIGASLGGLASIYTAILRPDVFGLAAGQSGAYSIGGEPFFRQVALSRIGDQTDSPGTDTRFSLVVGTYETKVAGDPVAGDLLAANRRLAEVLEAGNYEFIYEEHPEGHSWGLWQADLGRALNYLFDPAG